MYQETVFQQIKVSIKFDSSYGETENMQLRKHQALKNTSLEIKTVIWEGITNGSTLDCVVKESIRR